MFGAKILRLGLPFGSARNSVAMAWHRKQWRRGGSVAVGLVMCSSCLLGLRILHNGPQALASTSKRNAEKSCWTNAATRSSKQGSTAVGAVPSIAIRLCFDGDFAPSHAPKRISEEVQELNKKGQEIFCVFSRRIYLTDRLRFVSLGDAVIIRAYQLRSNSGKKANLDLARISTIPSNRQTGLAAVYELPNQNRPIELAEIVRPRWPSVPKGSHC